MKKSKSIFVLDDDPTICTSLDDYLSFKGFDVLAFNDGLKMLRVMEYGVPDLIISDVRMPDLHGISLLRRLKNNVKTMDIPVILMSAYEEDIILQEAKKLGAEFFLFKPFPLEYLDELIEKVLRQKEKSK